MSRTHCSCHRLLVATAVVATAIPVWGATLTIDPGQYGSYRADTSQVRAGTYSLRPQGGGFIWQDRNGVQTEDLSALTDGTYEIVARDANVVIGSFVNTGGAPSAAAGSITLVGNQIDFVNHDIAVSGAAGWTSPNAKIFNVAWSELNIARFVLPAGSGWDGWWGIIGDNAFAIDVAANGDVTVTSQSPAIGITGGNLQLTFPTEIEVLTAILSGNPPSMDRWAFDWATNNISPSLSTVGLSVYAGTYRFANNGNGAWVGNNVIVVPLDTVGWSTVKTWHDNTDNTDYTWTFAGPCISCPDLIDGLLDAICGLSSGTDSATYEAAVAQLIADGVGSNICDDGEPGAGSEAACEAYLTTVLLSDQVRSIIASFLD